MFSEILQGYSSLLSSPQWIILIAAAVMFYIKNVQEASLRKLVLGESENHPLVLTFYQVFYGLVGGFAISLLAGMFQIAFFTYLEVAIIFMLSIFSVTRFSGYVNVGFHALTVFLLMYLLQGRLISSHDLIQIFLFLGISMMVQGLIFLVSYEGGDLPVLFSRKEELRGGFRIEKSFMLPSVAAFVTAGGSILGSSLLFLPILQFFSMKETVMTFGKKEGRFILSALKIISGTVILLLSYLISFHMEWTYLLLAVVPALLYLEPLIFRFMEKKRAPKFVSSEEEIMVLEVRENSAAYLAGLRSGDRIYKVDGKINPTYKNLLAFMGTLSYERTISLEVRTAELINKSIRFTILPGTSTGILVVPPSAEFFQMKKEGKL
ncbi:hypothetical protein [Proteiniclasticum ruminis]|uniref:PDZ domain-containing protein n=1 Tax=Proteiniclasticum ruminis TaxID=398199 RepID=A0A1G8IJH9_9CLOT|nr:hypothetical protein [Proteiniclasticum ruminis]SDI19043.1 hypothetical protein SAMN05421804_101906 [Proteiniclasticum ruminis]